MAAIETAETLEAAAGAGPALPPGVSAEAIAALRAHPRFPDAARTASASLVAHYQGNRLLNTLVNDRGRVLMGNLALYLHYFPDPDDPASGLTVSRMKQLCVEQGVCSAGRAEAMLVLMRLFGYLEQAPSTADRRVRRLVATPRLVSSHQERWEKVFTAMALAMPAAETARTLVWREDFVRALVRRLFQRFTSGIRVLDYAPGLDLFTDRNAGMMVLFSLLIAGSEDDFPPRRAIPVSISALARRFGVSRVHVRKLLRDAEAERFIAREVGSQDRIVLLPTLADAALNAIAAMFLLLGTSARQAIEDNGLGAPA